MWGEFTGDRGIPRSKGQLCGNCSMWWRHHDFYKHRCTISTPSCLLWSETNNYIIDHKIRHLPKHRSHDRAHCFHLGFGTVNVYLPCLRHISIHWLCAHHRGNQITKNGQVFLYFGKAPQRLNVNLHPIYVCTGLHLSKRIEVNLMSLIQPQCQNIDTQITVHSMLYNICM